MRVLVNKHCEEILLPRLIIEFEPYDRFGEKYVYHTKIRISESIVSSRIKLRVF